MDAVNIKYFKKRGKVQGKEVIFYVMEELRVQFDRLPENSLMQVQLSDFVINEKTQELLKSRQLVENVLDVYLGINNGL